MPAERIESRTSALQATIPLVTTYPPETADWTMLHVQASRYSNSVHVHWYIINFRGQWIRLTL